MIGIGWFLTLSATTFGAASLLTGAVRYYAVSRRLLDIPNKRSSHDQPTPRGGGLAIVVVYLAALVVIRGSGLLAGNEFAAIFGGGLLVAGIGFWDDHVHVSPHVRFLAHLVAASWAIWWIGGVPALDLGFYTWQWGFIGQLIGVLGLVWLTNLNNFMDGIDGIAAAEVICASSCAALMLATVHARDLAWASWLLALSAAGFLVWNWPPARIFMGDVGSGFLGFSFGLLMLITAGKRISSFWPWIILFGVFVTDATVTLLSRAARGCKVYEAHRSHSYQHAAQRWSHLRVTSAVVLLNLLWLAPLACLAWRLPGIAPGLMIVALAPLVALARYLKAGEDPIQIISPGDL